jgi:hypothetical protein
MVHMPSCDGLRDPSICLPFVFAGPLPFKRGYSQCDHTVSDGPLQVL